MIGLSSRGVVGIRDKCRVCGESFTTPFIKCPLSGDTWASRTCPKCETEETKAERARFLAQFEVERAEVARRLWLRVCPHLYQGTDPSRLPQRPLAEVLAWQYGPEGLLLRGATGTGKTRAAYLLLKRLVLDEMRIVSAFDTLAFDHECVQRFRSEDGGEDWVDALAKVDVVFLDDFGKGCFTPRVEAELFGLIERRAANMLPIIATTNMTGAELAAKVTEDRGAPMVRRLREFCKCITFSEGKP